MGLAKQWNKKYRAVFLTVWKRLCFFREIVNCLFVENIDYRSLAPKGWGGVKTNER